MELFSIIIVIVIGLFIWGKFKDQEEKKRTADAEARSAKHTREAGDVREAFLSKYPNLDPASRNRTAKSVRELKPGDLIRTSMAGIGMQFVETPETNRDEVIARKMTYKMFTEFRPAAKKGVVWVESVYTEGHAAGTRAYPFNIGEDEQIAVYVEN